MWNPSPEKGRLAIVIIQFGAIAYQRVEDGALRLLLITSRDTGRWVVPRGNPIDGLAPHEAAAREAWEEAGIAGEVEAIAFGSYAYEKRLRDGSTIPALVHLFPLPVARVDADWPERAERRRQWFSPERAAAAVDEAELAALLLAFAERSTERPNRA